ncbi:MAG: hypothetical protein HS116_03615 [Planctomycetes bacterium]|nr:hypothetical protein [Planctomycetota bacterium]
MREPMTWQNGILVVVTTVLFGLINIWDYGGTMFGAFKLVGYGLPFPYYAEFYKFQKDGTLDTTSIEVYQSPVQALLNVAVLLGVIYILQLCLRLIATLWVSDQKKGLSNALE